MKDIIRLNPKRAASVMADLKLSFKSKNKVHAEFGDARTAQDLRDCDEWKQLYADFFNQMHEFDLDSKISKRKVDPKRKKWVENYMKENRVSQSTAYSAYKYK